MLLLATSPDMCRVAPPADDLTHVVVVVALVHAEVLLDLRLATLRRALDRDAGQRPPHQPLVGRVGPGDRHAQRHATAVGQQRPLGPALGSIGRVGAGFPPRPAAPWSSPRRSLATATRCPSTR